MTFANVAFAVALLSVVATAHTYNTYTASDCSGATSNSVSGAADTCATIGTYSSKWTAAKSGSCFTNCFSNTTIPCDTCYGSGSTWVKYICNATSKFTQTVSCTNNACTAGCTTTFSGYNFSSATCPTASSTYATLATCNFVQTFTASGDTSCTTATSLSNLICDKCVSGTKLICAGFIPTSALALIVVAVISAVLSM